MTSGLCSTSESTIVSQEGRRWPYPLAYMCISESRQCRAAQLQWWNRGWNPRANVVQLRTRETPAGDLTPLRAVPRRARNLTLQLHVAPTSKFARCIRPSCRVRYYSVGLASKSGRRVFADRTEPRPAGGLPSLERDTFPAKMQRKSMYCREESSGRTLR